MASFQSSDMIAWIYFTKDTPKMAFITSTRKVLASLKPSVTRKLTVGVGLSSNGDSMAQWTFSVTGTVIKRDLETLVPSSGLETMISIKLLCKIHNC